MKFQIVEFREFKLSDKSNTSDTSLYNTAFLHISSWDDYNFKTMFHLNIVDDKGKIFSIGNIKIGYKNQDHGKTYQKLDREFTHLPSNFFSLGQDIDFYVNLWELPKEIKKSILKNLNDVAYDLDLFNKYLDEEVMKKSLLRTIREMTVREQFRRIFDGKLPLTDFDFLFIRNKKNKIGEIKLRFNVDAESKPSTNIHAIIGRNGVGKTTLLNGMIQSFINKEDSIYGGFYQDNPYDFLNEEPYTQIDNTYFRGLIAVSFSIFDPFIPNIGNNDNYFYIGLKENKGQLKDSDIYFRKDFLDAFKICFSFKAKKDRWLRAIEHLESDNNFAEMGLSQLIINDLDEEHIIETISKMSSGHASILLIMTQLVAKVEEKTLVLLDEPESHLHPPLLSAFIRALSDLLDNRNAIAIIATHSPVVLQEIPKSCVWKIERTGNVNNAFRLDIETFGENVGVLTRKVFGLEVLKSGFYNLLYKEVNEGKSYDEIIQYYREQLGGEARLLLKAIMQHKDSEI